MIFGIIFDKVLHLKKPIMKKIFPVILSTLFFGITFILQASGQDAKFEKSLHKDFVSNANTVLDVNNIFGNITCNNWEKNEISVDVIISVWAQTDEKARQYMDAFDVKVTNDSTGGISFTSVIDDNKLDKSFKHSKSKYQIDYVINHPVYLKMNINNKYGNINFNEVSGKTNIHLKYGVLTAKNLAFDDTSPVSIIDVDYGKAVIDKISWCEFHLNYSTLDIQKSTASLVTSKYSNVLITNIFSLIATSEYDVYKISSCNRMNINSKYSNINSDKIIYDLQLDLTYGNCNIKQISIEFENVQIVSKYTDVIAPIADGSCYQISANVDYGTLKYSPKANIDRHVSSIGTSINGFIGCKGNANAKVSVDSKYGDVKLF